MTQRVAVLFLTHRWNQLIRLKFERLVAEVGQAADVFLLIDETAETSSLLTRIPPSTGNIAGFDREGLAGTLGYECFAGDRLVPGSTHFPLLAFQHKRTNHDLFFVVEFDVEFSGNWGEFVREVTGQSPDFASLHFFSFDQKPDWRWFREYRPGLRDCEWALDRRNLRRSFNPIYCLSRRAIELVDAAHRDGWRAHYELLLATILSRRGCRIIDLREVGGFCSGNEQDPPREGSTAEPSTVRWRPAVAKDEFLQRSTGRTLFHPVKKPWAYDGARLIEARFAPKKAGHE